jgi:hypothetical protein
VYSVSKNNKNQIVRIVRKNYINIERTLGFTFTSELGTYKKDQEEETEYEKYNYLVYCKLCNSLICMDNFCLCYSFEGDISDFNSNKFCDIWRHMATYHKPKDYEDIFCTLYRNPYSVLFKALDRHYPKKPMFDFNKQHLYYYSHLDICKNYDDEAPRFIFNIRDVKKYDEHNNTIEYINHDIYSYNCVYDDDSDDNEDDTEDYDEDDE